MSDEPRPPLARVSELEVRWSCSDCSIKFAYQSVRYRKVGERREDWMDHLTNEIVSTHAALSPRCPALQLSECVVPVPLGAEDIGCRPRVM